MLQYFIRRLLILPIIVLFVTAILFALILKMPAEQRAQIYMPPITKPDITQEEVDAIVNNVIDRYGLAEPFMVQYSKWLGNVFHGDWGYSPTWRMPVLDGLLLRAPASLELVLVSMIPAILLSFLFGGLAVNHHGRFPDHAIRTTTFIAWAFPSFILALLLLNVLYAWLGWFPPERSSLWVKHVIEVEEFRSYTGLLLIDSLANNNLKMFVDTIRHLVLPAFTLGFAQWALFTRMMRSSLLQSLSEDYIRTARAKSVRERLVINKHARLNALLPVISVGGVAVSLLVQGVVIVETMFAFEGIGYGAVDAILNADVPAIIGFTLFMCIVTLLASIFSDFMLAMIDPRIRFSGSNGV